MRTRVVTLVDRVGAAGGGESFAAYLAASLDPAAFESIVCVSRPSDARAVAAVRAAGVPVIELKRTGRLALGPWLRLVRFLRTYGVDVLHSHKFGSNVWAAVVSWVAGVPVFVAHEHSWSFAGDRLRLLLDRYLVGCRADAVVAVSSVDRRRIIERERLDAARVVLQPNGIPRIPPPRRGELRRELGLDPSVRIVGIVARLTREKRIDLYLDAFERLDPVEKRLLGVVVGDGPQRAALQMLAERHGVAAHVRFLGRRDDIARIVVDFDVAVLCSDREGCPLTLLEYMALGRPIAATRVGGVADVARDGAEALLVDPGDPVGLARAVGTLLDDRPLGRRLGEAAARRQETEFELGAVARRFETLYLRLLRQKDRRVEAGERELAPAPAGTGHARR